MKLMLTTPRHIELECRGIERRCQLTVEFIFKAPSIPGASLLGRRGFVFLATGTLWYDGCPAGLGIERVWFVHDLARSHRAPDYS